MARPAACAICGAAVPAQAAYCPSCGRSQRPALLELERLDVPTTESSTVERVVATTGGRPSRWQVAGLVAALAAVAGLIAVLVGSGGSDGADSSPTTTVSTSTTAPATTAPATTAATTTRPVVTTGAPSSTGPVVTYLNGAPSLVLGAPTGGQSLYVTNGSAVTRIELDTGKMTTAAVLPPTNGSPWYSASVHGGTLLVLAMGNVGSYRVPLDLSAPATLVPGSGAIYPVLGTDLVWSVGSDAGTGTVLTRTDGTVVANVTTPTGVNVVGALGDRLLFESSGRVYTLDRTGRVRAYANGTVQALNGGWVVWRACDDQARCSLHLGSADRADARALNLPDSLSTNYRVGPQMLSPDGRFLVAYTGQSFGLIDLTTGRVIEQSLPGFGVAWSADGKWMFHPSTSLRVEAVSTVDGRSVVISLTNAGAPTGNGGVLAVG